MKSFKLRKLLTVMAVAIVAAAALSPVKASAAWRQEDNGNWSYTENNSAVSGWKSINGNWYFFDSNSVMKTGWVLDGTTWYYLSPSGEMKTGWISDGGKWYYTTPSGAMHTGWLSNNGTWYYLNSSGAMQTGLIDVNGKTYYLNESGAMKTGNVAVNGINYTFGANGEKIASAATTPIVANSTAEAATGSGGAGGSGGSGGSGGGTGTQASSAYKDLYGTWKVGNSVSKSGKLTEEQIALCEGTEITLKDNNVYYGDIAVPATSISQDTMNSSDFTAKYNIPLSSDKVSSVSTTLKYNDLSANITIYTGKNKNNNEVHYALLKGTLFELNKK